MSTHQESDTPMTDLLWTRFWNRFSDNSATSSASERLWLNEEIKTIERELTDGMQRALVAVGEERDRLRSALALVLEACREKDRISMLAKLAAAIGNAQLALTSYPSASMPREAQGVVTKEQVNPADCERFCSRVLMNVTLDGDVTRDGVKAIASEIFQPNDVDGITDSFMKSWNKIQ